MSEYREVLRVGTGHFQYRTRCIAAPTEKCYLINGQHRGSLAAARYLAEAHAEGTGHETIVETLEPVGGGLGPEHRDA